MAHNRKSGYSKSRWAVERERLHIADHTPPAPDRGAAKLGDVIPTLMKRFGMEQALWSNTLEEEWPDLMGAVVAAHTRPGEVANKQLTVYVDSSVWLFELSQSGRGAMLDNLKKKYGPGKITEIRLQLDPGS